MIGLIYFSFAFEFGFDLGALGTTLEFSIAGQSVDRFGFNTLSDLQVAF